MGYSLFNIVVNLASCAVASLSGGTYALRKSSTVSSQGAAAGAESPDLKSRTLEAGHNIASEYRRLLQWVLTILNKPTVESKQQLPAVSRQIAQCVTELVAAAEQLKGTGDWSGLVGLWRLIDGVLGLATQPGSCVVDLCLFSQVWIVVCW